MKKKTIAALAASVLFGGGVLAAMAVEQPDIPFSVGSDAADSFESSIAERIQQAHRSLPTAKREFMAGMREGRVLFLTIRLMDGAGKVEQIFAQVDQWQNGEISGRIANNIKRVSGYQKGQTIHFSEGDILDWTIQGADGSSEGNYIGAYLEKWLYEIGK